MTLQQLIYFQKIAEHGSFIRASEELYVTQPSLSYAIQLLEQELEVPLFNRSRGKPLELTNFGAQLLPYVNSALSCLEFGMSDLKRAKNPKGGHVRIAVAFASSFSKVMTILRNMNRSEEYADILLEINIVQAGSKFLDELRNGSVDFAISGILQDHDISSVRLFSEDLVLLAPTDHRLAALPEVGPQQLAREPLVMYGKDTQLILWLERLFKSLGIEPNIYKFCENWSEVAANVIMGHGVAVSPHIPLNIEALAMIPFTSGASSQWTTNLLWSTNRKLTPAAQQVKEYLLRYQDQL